MTHALHFLPEVDYILTVVDGKIAERGTYMELMSRDGEFARFIREFSTESEDTSEDIDDTADKPDTHGKGGVSGSGIMQTEERNIGAVEGSVYRQYLQAANGFIFAPLLLLSLVLLQGVVVMSSYWSVFILFHVPWLTPRVQACLLAGNEMASATELLCKHCLFILCMHF